MRCGQRTTPSPSTSVSDMPSDVPSDSSANAEERQHVVRVPGARRAKLTPVEGTTSEPHTREERKGGIRGHKGPNDDRMLQDVPPHY